ncbi:MAG: hypothetical protein ACO2ZM_02125 [Francisellaceae bacterium]
MSEINSFFIAKHDQAQQSSSSLGDDPCDYQKRSKKRMCLGKSRQ